MEFYKALFSLASYLISGFLLTTLILSIIPFFIYTITYSLDIIFFIFNSNIYDTFNTLCFKFLFVVTAASGIIGIFDYLEKH